MFCCHVLANGALKPAEVRCHLEAKHPKLKSKLTECFEKQSTALRGQQKEVACKSVFFFSDVACSKN
jgi:hypothetical protein